MVGCLNKVIARKNDLEDQPDRVHLDGIIEKNRKIWPSGFCFVLKPQPSMVAHGRDVYAN